jgi:N6-adenosine-specific RNA methylase IME4
MRESAPYPDMTVEQICALPVKKLVAPDCVLWLWTTNAHMRESFAVLDAWGFESKTILTWAKPSFGVGHWLRGQTEHVHLAVGGNPTILSTHHATLLTAPVGAHSEKPEAFYQLVCQICPGSKVELFARRRRSGSWRTATRSRGSRDRSTMRSDVVRSIGMDTPPEVIFDRHLRNLRNRADRARYRGKADLDRVPDGQLPVTLLREIQVILNDALRAENEAMPHHVPHDPFHFDYVISDEENAITVCTHGYSFIGVTLPMIDAMWKSSERLAKSLAFAAILDMQLTDDDIHDMSVPQRIAVVIFRLQLLFIVLHEYAHVVHGHIHEHDEDAVFADEVRDVEGTFEQQVRETDADGYAAYFALANIFVGIERAHLLSVLGQTDKPTDMQDKVLLSCFVVATATYYTTATASAFANREERRAYSSDTVCTFTHPPQVARMNVMMRNVNTWCIQNDTGLDNWMTSDRLAMLMRMVSAATLNDVGHDWFDQIAFLRSDDGVAYIQKLCDTLMAHKTAGYK